MRVHKKIIQIISLLCASLMLMTACSNESSSDISSEEEKVLSGYYNEETVDLKLPSTSSLISFSRNESDELELFYVNNTEPKSYGKVTRKDTEWVTSEQEWISNIEVPSGSELNKVFRAEDGKYYVLFQKCDKSKVMIRLFQVQEDWSVQEIKLSGWEDEQEEDSIRYPIKNLCVLKNGDIVVKDYQEKLLQIFESDGTLVREEELSGAFTVSGNKVYAIDSSSHKLDVIDMEGEDTSIEYDSTQQGSYLYVFHDVVWYAGKTGINRLNLGGSLWQNIIAGENTCLGDDTTFPYDFVAIDNEDSDEYYYIVDQGDGVELVRYYYDEEKKISSNEKITIYSLHSLATVDNVIREFRKSYPDIQIEYKVGESTDSSATTQDLIRTFNAELLAGKGPDIIILDGLPLESYKEKGVLMDLSEVIDPLVESDKLYQNIVENYQEENGIYAMPMSFKMVGMFGYEEIVDQLIDMDTQDITDVGEDYDYIFAPANYNAMARIFYLLYKERFITDGVVDEEKLEQFLTNLNYLSWKCNKDEKSFNNVFLETDLGILKFDDMMLSQEIGLAMGKVSAGIYQYRNLEDLVYSFSVINQMGLKKASIDGQYIPSGLIGINKSSKNQKMASDFIEMAFNDKTQETYIGDGFPVNKAALASWSEYLYKDEESTELTGDYVVNYPREQEFKQLQDMIPGCEKPLQYEEAVDDRMIELVQSYLEGATSLSDTLSNMVSVIQLHNAE